MTSVSGACTEDLSNKVALVTGAGKGIGRCCALKLAKAGAHVIAVARTEKDLDVLEEEADGSIQGWCADIGVKDFYQQLRELDQLDILVNNAGTNRPEPFTEVSDENLNVVLDLNVRAAFQTAQAAVDVMLKGAGGSVIHVGSQMGHVGSPNRTVYCMTKHAIEGLSKAMAVELASKGIRSNVIAPTFVDTPMTRPMMQDPDFAGFVQRMIPAGRMATTEEIANAVLFLAGPGSAMCTGISLRVDGGWTAQ